MKIPASGEIFENFKILKDLGSGGMGQVLLAEDIQLGRKVALKFLHQGHQEISPVVFSRFEREARVLASFNHPNIVNIYSIGKFAGGAFIAMEYVEGSTVAEVIESNAFGVEQASEVIKQILMGLAEAHKKGILHRDIKPENLLLDFDNHVKIVDFGICKDLAEDGERITKENLILGTISYMAPEVIKYETPSPAADIFSLGVVFYELVVGGHPFMESTAASRMYRICNEAIRFPKDMLEHVPEGMPELIEKMTALDLMDRYQSAEEVLQGLSELGNVNLPSFKSVELDKDVVFPDVDSAHEALLLGGYDIDEAEKIIELSQAAEEDNSTERERQVAAIMSGASQQSSRSENQFLKETGPISKQNIELAKQRFESHRNTIVMPSNNRRRSGFDLKKSLNFLIHYPKLTFLTFFCVCSFLIWKNSEFNLPRVSQQRLEFFQNFLKDINRSVASVPPKTKQPFKKGSTLKIQRIRENLDTGVKFFDVTDELKIVSSSGDIIFSKLKDGQTQKESVLQFTRNPFLPPLRKFSKGHFDIKNVIVGSDKNILPLQVGKRFDLVYNTEGLGAEKQFSQSCEVVLLQKIKEIDVFQVNCTLRSADRVQASEIFFSPSHNLILREVRTVQEEGQRYREIHQVIGL